MSAYLDKLETHPGPANNSYRRYPTPYPVVYSNPSWKVIYGSIHQTDAALGAAVFATGPVFGYMAARGVTRRFRTSSILTASTCSALTTLVLLTKIPYMRLTGQAPNSEELCIHGAEENVVYVEVDKDGNPTGQELKTERSFGHSKTATITDFESRANVSGLNEEGKERLKEIVAEFNGKNKVGWQYAREGAVEGNALLLEVCE